MTAHFASTLAVASLRANAYRRLRDRRRGTQSQVSATAGEPAGSGQNDLADPRPQRVYARMPERVPGAKEPTA